MRHELERCMSGRRARALRKQVYGEGGTPKAASYVKHSEKGVILADMKRHDYQEKKKGWAYEKGW